MKIFRDGISVGKEITRKYMPNSNQEEVISKLKTVFEDKFILSRAIQGYIYNKNLFYKKYLEAVECSKNDLKIPPQVSSLWFNIFLENYEQSFWTSCTTGQRAELFVACSSTELNPSIIFGNGVEVREGVLYGNFGVCSDIKNFEDIKNTNDFVPFSYMITHNNLPKAIIFLSSVESLDKTKNCDICSFEQKIRDANIVCSDPVGLVNLRRLKYVQDVKDAKHYSDNYGYKHVILKEGKEFFHKIPIIAAVFNKRQ
ncbi:MAG: hypothetical protein N3D10_02490 [Candidatus Micrarchaeota archaeon]|nr:hypothetical protein [Candidatus Micrarchaeota archaeon]